MADKIMTAAPQAAGAGEIDLYDDKVQAGIAWTMRQWGETLGLKTWTQGDGSESVEGDVGAEIHTILVDAGLRDPETNEMAALRAPSREPEGGAVEHRQALERIGNRETRRELGAGDYGVDRSRCPSCGHAWDDGKPEHHAAECALMIARAALATREEAPAEAVEDIRQAIKLAIVANVSIGEGRFWGIESATDRILAALSAQPQAREDAQPVAYRMRCQSDQPHKGGWWSLVGKHDGDHAIATGGGKNLQPLYTHPAPDALRVAVEALERIATVDMGGGFLGALACRQVATKALSDMKTNQKGDE